MNRKQAKLARLALAHIVLDPKSWDQKVWRCGTKMCFAGHVAVIAGGQWARGRYYSDDMLAEPNDDKHQVYEAGKQHIIACWHRAQRLLGLNDKQAEYMFCALRDFEQLRDAVETLARGESIDERCKDDFGYEHILTPVERGEADEDDGDDE